MPNRIARIVSTGVFRDVVAPKHRTLFLPRFLAARADETRWQGPERDAAHAIIKDWANLADTHALDHKETALDGDFLERIFGRALGYASVSESPNAYQRQKQFHVPGVGTADGALGAFSDRDHVKPVAVIELKGAEADLDHDKFNGRTPVQQLWDYLNALPECPWGIVSNYRTIRLYHRDRTPQAYEEFHFHNLIDPAHFARFWYVLERGGLLASRVEPARAPALLKETRDRQKEAGDDLYDAYSNQRTALIRHLIDEHLLGYDDAIAAAQKLLDRVIFIAFCADRGLLPQNIIETAIKDRPRFSRVTNPIWNNFRTLFGWIDKGDAQMEIPPFNGGLFATDDVVDNLQLADDWTNFFATIDKYDFRDEVNVEVLGHLFEKSITELEKLRIVGFFGPQAGSDGQPEMPKSALRKRFGIYYTPADFTELIVNRTVGELIARRVDPLKTVDEKLAALRALKIVDPACGSGAFLIAAYQRLDDAYGDLVRLLRIDGDEKSAARLEAAYPDYILHENLYGVDLSREAVEITQLALWIRSARKDRTLADLSKNIVWGNSLVSDKSIHPKAMEWHEAFPEVFKTPSPCTPGEGGEGGGFDCVIGNPPWEKISIKKREFFSLVPDVLLKSNASEVREVIERLDKSNPDLAKRWASVSFVALAMLKYAKASKSYPLTARGDINLYMLFAELGRKLVAPTGRVGLLVPSGIATDDTTKHFFNDLMQKQSLVALYDFENKQGHFEDVHRAFKFSVLLMTGSAMKHPQAEFVFFAHQIEDLAEKDRQITLSSKDLKLVNPNTKTCPIFRTQRDAELTKAIYKRIPVLIDETRREGGNPWLLRLTTMFHQSADAELFKNASYLKGKSLALHGNIWRSKSESYLPCYESKMVQPYDHRAADVRDENANWLRRGQTDASNLVNHQNPEFVVMPRWWVQECEVEACVGSTPAILSFRKVTSPTNTRTMLATFIPRVGVVDSQQLVLFPEGRTTWRVRCCLLANLNTYVYDYVTRQKIGGVNLNFFIVEQLPTLPPDVYEEKCPWDKTQTLERWISERVLRLTCTSNDMLPLAKAAGFEPGIVKWKEEERGRIRAELDAAYFRLYGIDEDDIEYILGTFQGVANEDEAHGGIGPTRQRIHEALEWIK
ncbi:MAG: N-6 DNA methylase [Phycisphaerales bacterium]|nr:N-6 DNA methylase [Phycisphaerales bacterium]